MLVDHSLKSKKEYKSWKELEIQDYLVKKPGKAWFKNDMSPEKFSDSPRRRIWNKVLRDKVFNIAKNLKNNWYQHGLGSLMKTFFDKRSSGSGVKSETMPYHKLDEVLHKPTHRKFEKRKVYSSFKDNNLGFYLADMQLINKYNKGFHFFVLCYWYL